MSRQIVDLVQWNKKTKPTLEVLKEMLKTEGLQSELYSDPPAMKYGRHKHDFDDFLVIVSCKMKIGTEDGTWVMNPGDRLDLSRNTVHWTEVVGKEEVKYLSAAK